MCPLFILLFRVFPEKVIYKLLGSSSAASAMGQFRPADCRSASMLPFAMLQLGLVPAAGMIYEIRVRQNRMNQRREEKKRVKRHK